MKVTYQNVIANVTDFSINGTRVAVIGLSGGLEFIKSANLTIEEIEAVEVAAVERTQALNGLTLQLTELETKVIAAIKEGDDFDDMPCNCLGNIKDYTGLTANVIRGVISSLIKKDLVMTGEYPNGMTAFYYKG